MIGELDYDGLFYGDGKDNIFSGFVMLALAIFIVIIVVLLVNFLIGLAAEEIRVSNNILTTLTTYYPRPQQHCIIKS